MRCDEKYFSSLYTAIQQLPANIDKGIKIKREREIGSERKGKQIPSFLLAAGVQLNKGLCFALNKHNGRLN